MRGARKSKISLFQTKRVFLQNQARFLQKRARFFSRAWKNQAWLKTKLSLVWEPNQAQAWK